MTFVNRKLPSSSPSARRTHKSKPFNHITTPERAAHFQRSAKIIKNLKKKNARLEEKLKLLITEEGIEVDEGFDEILSEVMEKATDSVEFENLFQVSTNPDAEAEKEFFAIFIEQQLQGRNLKAQNKFSGMR